jgi:Leucine-rich repeat (LRR) protein
MYSCSLSYHPRSLVGLEELHLAECGLRALPEGIAALSGLRKLDLGVNKWLARLPEGLWSLARLESLDLGHCRLTALPEGIGALAGLRVLYRPGRPGRLSALRVFPCESVLYGTFVWARGALSSQKRRFLARAVSGNEQLTALPAGLWSLAGLEELYLGSCALKVLPGLGRIVALCDHAPNVYHVREHIRCLYF